VDYNDFTKEIIKEAETAIEGYFEYAAIIARRLPKRLHEQLNQLVNGPVWDGNVLSKSYRSELIEYGLAMRVCSNGEQGFTGATYLAYSVNKIITEISSGKRC